jgi:FdhD protein
MNPFIMRQIIKNHGMSLEEKNDFVAAEIKLRILCDGQEIITLYCTPLMIKELVAGLLLTEGILTHAISPDDISIEQDEEITVVVRKTGNVSEDAMVFSRYLGGFSFRKKEDVQYSADEFSLSADGLKTVFREFQQKSDLFKLTGCFHSAALSDGTKILSFAEDIGRHNAVDKVIGHALLNNISFDATILVVTCRISSEIMSKCARWKIPVIASRSAPTGLAIHIAELSGITLIGFVRGDSLNIYSHAHRLKISSTEQL